MATYKLRRLGRPEILRSLDIDYLDALLAPHADYLSTRGLTLPVKGREAPLKYMTLAQIFLRPDESVPRELTDALYFVDEMATPAKVDHLLAAAAARNIRWHPRLEMTPADVVLQFWMNHRQLVERAHAELAVRRFRAFDYFQPRSVKAPRMTPKLPVRLEALEADLNDRFLERGYGKYVRIILDEQEDSVWFYIGHGGMLRREAAVKREAPTTVCFRPEIYDVVIFVRLTGELGIHAGKIWEKDLYQRLFGKHLFGDADLFAGKAKYTLDPLWNDGEQALRCQDVPGIEWVKLTYLRTFQPGRAPLFQSYRSRDLFVSWDAKRLPFPRDVHLLSAGFRLKLLGGTTPRLLTIHPCNRAQYSRDADRPWLEKWLERRGFIRQADGGEDAEAGSVLAVA